MSTTYESHSPLVRQRRMRLTARELKGQLTILAVLLWGAAAINMATPTWRLRSGQTKATDFVHFYALARLGAAGHADRFADLEAQRRAQLEGLPESADDWFPPAYGPQVALLLAPLGYLTYGRALLVWLAFTAALYLIWLRTVILDADIGRSHFRMAMLAAIAYPPFWSLVEHGQLSSLALTFFLMAWQAIRRGHRVWAGVALGLLAYKPPLAVPVLCVLLLAAEWRMLIAAACAACGQTALSTPWVGLDGVKTYGELLLASPRLALLLTAQPSQMHSWRSFWALLVPQLYPAVVLYAIFASATLVGAAVLWRRLLDVRLRMATLLIATVLASPHLYAYDLVVLAPAWVWLTDWYLRRADLPGSVGRTLYTGYVAPLFSVMTTVVRVQLSTLCFGAVLFWLWRYGAPKVDGNS